MTEIERPKPVKHYWWLLIGTKHQTLFTLVIVFIIALLLFTSYYMFNSIFIPKSPVPTSQLILDDALDNQNDSNGWSTATPPESCQFVKRAYQASEKGQDGYSHCTKSGDFYDLSDMRYQVDMQILQGDCGGLLFRYAGSSENFYDFEVCEKGFYMVFIYTNGESKYLIYPKKSLAIHTGFQQQNQLLVQAKGRKFAFFVNGKLVGSVEDATYTKGYFGVIVSPHRSSTAVAAFRNAKVWSLED